MFSSLTSSDVQPPGLQDESVKDQTFPDMMCLFVLQVDDSAPHPTLVALFDKDSKVIAN